MLLNKEHVNPNLLSSGVNVNENLWYLDNDASNHMTGRKEKFTSLDDRVSGAVKFGDGSSARIEGKGSILFRCKNGEEKRLNDV